MVLANGLQNASHFQSWARNWLRFFVGDTADYWFTVVIRLITRTYFKAFAWISNQ